MMIACTTAMPGNTWSPKGIGVSQLPFPSLLAQVGSRSFYEVLIELSNRTDLLQDHREQVERTLDWIQGNLEPDEWSFRSAVITSIGGAARTPEQQMIWNTVTQALNCAVEKTIDADVGSTGYLPYSPPIGVYRHIPYNGLLAVDDPSPRMPQVMPSLTGRFRSVGWDPLAMSWTTLREIATETSGERLDFQNASVASRDNDMLERLIVAISAQSRDNANLVPEPAAMFVEAAMAAGGGAFGVLFGGGAGVVAAGAAAGIVGTHGAITAIKSAFRRSRRFQIVNTLRHEFNSVLDKSQQTEK
jgi:hypothetical protein